MITFIIGIILYSFLDYAVHRWVLHGPLIRYHSVHHKYPDKQVRTPFYVLLPALIILAFVSLSLAAGTAFGWIVSSGLHWRLHEGTHTASWMLRLQDHHNGHHSSPSSNFGVTTIFWDRIFGTSKSEFL